MEPFVAGDSVLSVKSLTVAGGTSNPQGRVNLGDNAMVVDYAGASVHPIVEALVDKAHNGGDWNGNGITSTQANASTRSIGVAEGPHGAPEFFDPADVDDLFSAPWTVQSHCARTGIRLDGPKPRMLAGITDPASLTECVPANGGSRAACVQAGKVVLIEGG